MYNVSKTLLLIRWIAVKNLENKKMVIMHVILLPIILKASFPVYIKEVGMEIKRDDYTSLKNLLENDVGKYI